MHSDDTFTQKATEHEPTTRSTEESSTERTTLTFHAPHRGLRALLASTPTRVALATGLTCCLGVAAYAGTRQTPEQPERTPVAEAAAERIDAAERSSRSLLREDAIPTSTSLSPTDTASPTDTPSPTDAPSPTDTASPTDMAEEESTPSESVPPQPVAGLTQIQMDNAKTIVDVGTEMNIPHRGLVVAIATAMQESTLLNYANASVPESQNYPHEAVGWDHDSVGLFQQRSSTGWGSISDLMTPTYAATAFYEALLQVPGWQEMSVAWAAQSVQVSAFPDAYAQHETRATTIVSALV
ncbi:hypothetical protein [Salinispora mooreana]|uniref:hypothetical protein n=1 Tax=Salinispora mooreana TaxID=999545 RepID=UPI0003723142|nr:hypothetical protein [Salinispora mooreana]